MGALRRFLRRLVNAVKPDRAETDLSRELASHLALLEDEYRRRGMPATDAHRAARVALGGIERTKELHRAARSFAWLDDARRDGVYAARLLRRNPIITATAVLSLAIGIGANTAIFTVANALLFRAPTGVIEPDRLVHIGVGRDDGGFNPAPYPTYLDVRRQATTLDGVYAHHMFPHAVSFEPAVGGGGMERAYAHFVTIGYFPILGARAAAGRLFGDADDETPGAAPVTVLSHRFWSTRFDSNPSVVGQTVRVNGYPVTVIGVAPEGFQGTGVLASDLWLPLNMSGVVTSRPPAAFTGASVIIGARLKPGVPIESAAAEIDTIGRDINRDDAKQMGIRRLRLVASSSVPGNRTVLGVFFALLMAIVSVVLLVACANVSGILLARAAARRREIAVRLAIGAGRARLIRQLLMETMVIFALGGAAGVFLARVTTSILVPLLPQLPFPISVSLPLDGRVMAFTGGLSFVAALISGLAPALQASKADVVIALKDESQGPSGRSRLRHAFVVAQFALSIVLVVSASLFVRALVRAGATSPGFDPRGVELASVDLSMSTFTDVTGARFARELIERVRQQLGVETATLAKVLPGGFEGIGLGGFSVPGNPDALRDEIDWNIVEPGYFSTVRIPLTAGRDFSAADSATAQPVVIVSESAGRRFWPGEEALGKSISQQIGQTTRSLLVIGVAGDIKSSSLIDGLSNPFVYLPLQQHFSMDWTSTMTIAVRSAVGQPVAHGDAIRRLVASMDPRLAIVTSQSLAESVALGLVPQRIAASVAGSLGFFSLILAAIGIYGVTAYAVMRHMREFGIRIALGAAPADIVRMVLRQGLTLIATGCAIGLALGAGVGHLLSVFLFGVPPLDPLTFVGAAALFSAVGVAACYGPARLATKADPLIALRRE